MHHSNEALIKAVDVQVPVAISRNFLVIYSHGRFWYTLVEEDDTDGYGQGGVGDGGRRWTACWVVFVDGP
jgi:hypothetical protein